MSRNSYVCLAKYPLIRMDLSLVYTRLVLHACEMELTELSGLCVMYLSVFLPFRLLWVWSGHC